MPPVKKPSDSARGAATDSADSSAVKDSAQQPAIPTQADVASDGLRVGYTLLHQLAGQLRRVNQIFILKSAPDEVQAAVKPVAGIFGRLHSTLKQWSDADGAARFVESLLPAAEKSAREAIEKTRSGELLGASDEEFVRRLLASQDEALTYAIHLAEAVLALETSASRRQALAGFITEMRQPHAAVARLAFGGG